MRNLEAGYRLITFDRHVDLQLIRAHWPTTMSLDAEEYSKLLVDEQNQYDAKRREQEHAEQAALPYRWSQKLDHVEVNIPVPSGTRARQVQVTFKSTALFIKVHDIVLVEVCSTRLQLGIIA